MIDINCGSSATTGRHERYPAASCSATVSLAFRVQDLQEDHSLPSRARSRRENKRWPVRGGLGEISRERKGVSISSSSSSRIICGPKLRAKFELAQKKKALQCKESTASPASFSGFAGGCIWISRGNCPGSPVTSTKASISSRSLLCSSSTWVALPMPLHLEACWGTPLTTTRQVQASLPNSPPNSLHLHCKIHTILALDI